MNTAVYLLRAKQVGLTLVELDQMEEGQVMDLLIEQGNDMVADEVYCEVADQAAFDAF